MQSSSSAIDGDPVRQRRSPQVNQTTTHNHHHDYSPTKDDDSDKDLATSSVTHWSSIMRQESWLDAGENATTALLLDSVLSDADLAMIEDFWDQIMPTVSYLGTEVVAKIYKALCVAYRAHRGQMRKSGEPFIIHVSTSQSSSSRCGGDGTDCGGCLLHYPVGRKGLTWLIGDANVLFCSFIGRKRLRHAARRSRSAFVGSQNGR